MTSHSNNDKFDSKSAADEAINLLAQRLYETMERLDPSDEREWAALSSRERRFYELCVSAILEERELVALAATNDD